MSSSQAQAGREALRVKCCSPGGGVPGKLGSKQATLGAGATILHRHLPARLLTGMAREGGLVTPSPARSHPKTNQHPTNTQACGSRDGAQARGV